MKKILLLHALFLLVALLTKAQPISGIPDKNFYPSDSGKQFWLEYKLYQSYTRFSEGLDGGVFARIQSRRFATSQTNDPETQLEKDLNFQDLVYCNAKMGIPPPFEPLSLWTNGGMGTFKGEDGKYYMFVNYNNLDSLTVTTVDSGNDQYDYPYRHWFKKSKMPIARLHAAGRGALGGHVLNQRFVFAWLSSDPVFVGNQENCTMIRYDKQKDSQTDRKFSSGSISVQKSALQPNGDIIGVCAYVNAGSRNLKVMRWDSSLVAIDSFQVTNN